MDLKEYHKLVLIIGCHGRSDVFDDITFISCHSATNAILFFDDIKQEDFEIIINYLDRISGVIHKTIYNTNIISNTLRHLYDHGMIKKELYLTIINFMVLHKRCGFYLKVESLECLLQE